MQWLTPTIPTTWEAEIERSQFEATLGKKRKLEMGLESFKVKDNRNTTKSVYKTSWNWGRIVTKDFEQEISPAQRKS
jgi:hypothetical protein